MARAMIVGNCFVAIVLELVALALVTSSSGWLQIAALLVHCVATLLMLWVPPSLRVARQHSVELHIDGLMTFSVPLIGALLALVGRRSLGTRFAEAGHTLRQFHDEVLESHDMRPRRSLFTGQPDRDLAAMCDAESFAAILEHGTPDHKRNALRKLAKLGQPKHMALLRRCLTLPDAEVALFAHAQITQAEDQYLARIHACTQSLGERPGDLQVQAELSDAHRSLATSGVLDSRSARWHMEESLRQQAGLSSTPMAPVNKGHESDEVRESIRDAAEAIERRDFDRVRAIHRSLNEAGAHVPVWLSFAATAERERVA